MAALKLNDGYDQIKKLLSSTVTLLCKNGVPFTHKLHVEALVGVTVDTNDVFFVHISETIPHADQLVESREASPARHGGSDHGYHRQAEGRSGRGATRREPYQRPGPLSSKSSPRNHCPSTRSGSPAAGRQQQQKQQQQQQHRNGTVGHQPRRQHQTDFMVAEMPSPLQKGHGLQSPLQDSSESMPSPVQKHAATDSDDVVLIKEEHVRMPDRVAKQATMVAGQRRASRAISGAEVTIIEPDPSVDDTQAMQQGYLNTAKPRLKDIAVDTGVPAPPPAKRQCTTLDSNNSSNSSFMSDRSPTDTTATTSSSAGPYFAGQWAVGEPSSLPPHPVTYSDPPSRTIQAFPSCSTWAAPANAQLNTSTDAGHHTSVSTSTRGFKNPRNNTMCQPVRDVLEFSLAQPVLAQAFEVSAFRLFWRGHDTIAGWQNIIYNRLELDAIVAEHSGVSFFISAITATARDPKTIIPTPTDARLRAYPALGYWIVSRDATFDRHSLMKKLSNAAEGGELKTMLQNDGEKANETGALNLIVKDYGKGYVQQRVSESAQICCGPGEEHPTIRFILKEDFFEEKLREAVDLLTAVGCPVSLEKVDMEALNPEEEEVEGAAADEEGNDQDGTSFDDFVIHVVKDEQDNSDSEKDGSPEPTVSSTEQPPVEILSTRTLSTESPPSQPPSSDNLPEETPSADNLPEEAPSTIISSPKPNDKRSTPGTSDLATAEEASLLEALSMTTTYTNSASVNAAGSESPENLRDGTMNAIEPSSREAPSIEAPSTGASSTGAASTEAPSTEALPSEHPPAESHSMENLSESVPTAKG